MHTRRLALIVWLVFGSGCEEKPLTLEGPGDSGPVATADSGAPPDADADGDGSPLPEDCDDGNPAVFPGAEEVCNGVDDDCDGETDEGVLGTWYADLDGDGHGDPGRPVAACDVPDDAAATPDDCNDRDPAISPSAAEVCNDQDDDCDDEIDEDAGGTLYRDDDGDGYGLDGDTTVGCPEAGWAELGGDCDDAAPAVHPGMTIDQCDGADTDCDGDVDEDSKAGWALLTVDTNAGLVLDIDPTSASSTTVTPVSTELGINSMDVSENGLSVVHLHSGSPSIATFDACTGTSTLIGVHGGSALGGIGFGPSGRLFGIGSGDVLYELDLATGAATVVGPLGIDIGNSGLAWDCSTQTMYGADGRSDRIFEIDLATGAARNVRTTDVPFASVGLEFDRVSGLLYASDGRTLYTVDPATGATTTVGPIASASNADDLAWHPVCP